MMRDSMSSKRIGKPFQVGVHNVLMQRPLEKAAIDHSADETDSLPKKEVAHENIVDRFYETALTGVRKQLVETYNTPRKAQVF